MIKNILKFKTIALITAICFPIMAQAVTQKEMEQARTIAAKAYLRYANDGSGYLDDINPVTMEELEGSLKTKEKENIKAFKEIPVPSDYKDWNKDKLVEYWAVTAFQNKGLLEKGRGGRIRARSLINKMTIAPPQATSQATESTPVAAVASNNSNEPIPSTKVSADTPGKSGELDKLKSEELDALADEEIIEEDSNVDKAYNYTWVYIMILCILVAVVVALVAYAANVMKKNGSSHIPQNIRRVEDEEALEHLESVVADKDVEISMLKKKLETANNQNSELKKKIDALTEELAILKSAAPKPVVSENRKPSLRSIYLGRANNKGIFVRADRTLNVGHSVFLLDTADGFSGTFKVADSPAAWSLALSNPEEYLETACSGHNLNDTSDADRIVTETAGTALFEGGCWRVVRKARIRYE